MARSILPLACLLACASLVACSSEPAGTGEPDDPTTVSPKQGGPSAGGASQDPSAPGGETTPGDPASPGGASCIAQPKCDGAGGPDLGPIRPWASTLSQYVVDLGAPYHRGRDMIYSVGDAQWILGKFTYSLVDKEIKGEDVDIYVERGCAGAWEKLGTAQTTHDGDHTPVEGVDDSGGRIYFQVPADKTLGIGRHRIRLVVAGDHTSTDLLLDIVPKGTKIVVSDVDGTLTSSESAEFPALLTGDLPGPQPGSADALAALAGEGYRIVYLSARPEWLTNRTKEFIDFYGFPPGIVHTTSTTFGAIGNAARDFKSGELELLKGHGMSIGWAFGNQPSDTDAYQAANIMPVDHRVFLNLADPNGGRQIASFNDLLPTVTAEPRLCK
jgi:hypothetical protein